MLIKHYRSNYSELHINVVTADGTRVRIHFMKSGSGSLYITKEKYIQDAMEASSLFNKEYSLTHTEDETGSPIIPVIPEPQIPVNAEKITVSNISEARAILIGKGVPSAKFRNSQSVANEAKKLGIEFIIVGK